MINGRLIVCKGEMQTIDVPKQVEQHNRLAHQLRVKAGLAS